MIATLNELKTFLGIGAADTEHDVLLTALADGVSSRIALGAGRIYQSVACLEKASLTEQISVHERGKKTLWLRAYPVVSITQIKEALYGGYTDVDAFVENTDYQIDKGTGALYRIAGQWLPGMLTVEVQYTGGYTPAEPWTSGEAYVIGDVVYYLTAIYTCKSNIDPSATAPPDDTDHWTLATGEVAMPADIVRAAVMQAAFFWQRRGKLGLTSAGVQGGSFSSYQKDELLPEVRQVMAKYRRRTG